MLVARMNSSPAHFAALIPGQRAGQLDGQASELRAEGVADVLGGAAMR